MNALCVLILLLPACLFGVGLPLLPIQQVEAENIDFDEKVLTLTGKVSVAHEIGTIHCNKGILHLNDAKTPANELAVNKILLYGNVSIDFTDGSQLTSEEGQLDCVTMEGIFTSQPPSKVVYTSFAQDENQKIPVRASSRLLRAKIIKTPQGYSLSSVKGEGAVNIEYVRPLEVMDKKQEESK